MKHHIEHLLQNIGNGVHPYIDELDLAEQAQIDEQVVFDFVSERQEIDDLDSFLSETVDLLNSEWYRDLYQEHVDRTRQAIFDRKDIEETNRAHMPTWRP